jgi:hypothetical protein
MFCPACKAEYRPGFTHCADCDVDLVTSLDAVPTNAIRQEDLDNPSLLWTGTSGEAQAALCTALETVNIPYLQKETDVGMIPGLARPLFAVFVKARDLDGAQLVLERVAEQLETDDSGAPSDNVPSSPQESADAEVDDGDSAPVPDDIAENFRSEHATEEVWSGADSDMAEIVRVCLRENGIGSVVEDLGKEKAVLVMADSEPRAREIIREIVRGTPTP